MALTSGAYRCLYPQSRLAWNRCLRIGGALLFFEMLLVVALANMASHDQLLSESGPFEVGSIVLYLLASVVMLVPAFVGLERRMSWRGAVLLAVLAAREANFHNRFTTEGVLRMSYYFRAHVPLTERITVAIILLALIYVAMSFLVIYMPRILAGTRDGVPWALFGVFGYELLVLSKCLDAMTWMVRAVGIHWEPSLEVIKLFEETMEFTGAAALFLSAALWMLLTLSSCKQSTH